MKVVMLIVMSIMFLAGTQRLFHRNSIGKNPNRPFSKNDKVKIRRRVSLKQLEDVDGDAYKG